MNELKKVLKKLKTTGFFDIFFSSILSKVFVFLGSIVLVRILDQADYGIYAYVVNIISFLSLIGDLGVSSAMLNYFLNDQYDDNTKGKIFIFSIKIGIVSALISSTIIFVLPYIVDFSFPEADKLIQILFLLPIFNIANLFLPSILRANLDNKRYAKLNFINVIINYVVLIPAAYYFSLNGIIISKYIYVFLLFLVGLWFTKSYLKKYKSEVKIEKKLKKEFLKFSLASQVNNTISSLLIIIDTLLVGYLIADANTIAVYKVATGIPLALAFLPSIVAVYILPYFIKKKNNTDWFKKNFKRVIGLTSGFFGIFCLTLFLLSGFIIEVLYGIEYIESSNIFRVLIIGFFFSASFKIPLSNMIYAMGHVKVNIIVNVVALVLNIILNVIFINQFGAIGAALTTAIIYVVISIIYYIYISKKFKNESFIEVKND